MSSGNFEYSGRQSTIAIGATFTAEPLRQSLDFWTRELGMEAETVFAPPNQLFQQLLDPTSLFATNRQGTNVLLVRFEDWQKGDSRVGTAAESADFYQTIEQGAEELIRALAKSLGQTPVPHLLCFCPPSETQANDSRSLLFFKRIQEWVFSELKETGDVYVITPEEMETAYPVAEYNEPYAEQLAQIPYTDPFYAALGTMIARKIWAVKNARYKVIVLDCDQTLWSGVCGEDGPLGIQVEPVRHAIQEFMVRQHDAGMLLCLCSKNNEEDVFNVFDCHPDMPLKRNHIVSWRINWKPKSENIKSLAKELNLGLDSFIFLDDDPVQCAEVQANCPEVLTFELPGDGATILRLLRHNWAFDHHKITDEGRERTALYRQNSERERFRGQALTLEEFVADLDLDVQISLLAAHQVARVSELTQRTTQFNTTTIKGSAAEIQKLVEDGEGECLTVRVKDRFGDYGLVGVIIFRVISNSFLVDRLLLSCRALGRGVEYRMLAKLGDMASERGLERIDIPYSQTSRNSPALDFLHAIGKDFKEPSTGGFLFKFPVGFATQLTYNPKVEEKARDVSTTLRDSALPVEKHSSSAQARAAMLRWIALELSDPARIHTFVSRRTRARTEASVPKEFVLPRSPVEKQLAYMISELLGIGQAGIYDNFFELGGDSLWAVKLLSRIRDTFRVELTVAQLFEKPTIDELSGLVMHNLQAQVQSVVTEDMTDVVAEMELLSDDEARQLLKQASSK